MGSLVKLIDALLFLLLLAIAFETPLIEGQACLPITLYPDFLVELRSWYAGEVGDYLMTETPDFYVGIIWVELLFQWPLVLVNLYGILAGKHWFNTTCLSYGISLFTGMVTVLHYQRYIYNFSLWKIKDWSFQSLFSIRLGPCSYFVFLIFFFLLFSRFSDFENHLQNNRSRFL